jgi:hypothetical protein
MAGLNPNIRLVTPEARIPTADDIDVQAADEAAPASEADENGDIFRIEHEDGSISVSINDNPIERGERANRGWFSNLVDDIDDMELSRIADDLLRGIDDDLQSRKEWIETRAQGLSMLGLKIEIPGLQGASDGAPVEGMSKVRHPMMLEACLRFQANARSELLPTDGPVKIRNDSNGSTLQLDQMADALEKDLNHYLTSTASEYYPDTDRMLLMLGFGGSAFKKVYFCPLRNRPVSESVDAEDLIVNNAATDLNNAKRITHRIMMQPTTVRRMQILGVYRDVDLSVPRSTTFDAAKREKAAQEGVTLEAQNPEDRDREIYECYCDLDITGFEHRYKGKDSGLAIPYRVTIDVSSREILSIVRNYDEDTDALPEKRTNFVHYVFVPGFGFYGIGLLHIMGNTTNAVTAGWREMLDAGMFANFPGFLMADTGARQNTNIFRVPPGGGALVKTNGMKISDAIMPLPYKEPGMGMMNLVNNMVETGQRLGGTAEVAVGEGKSDAPVGTTLALIDQATKVLNSVHKRMHAAQAQEFQLLVDCFREHPDSFWQRNRRPAYQWDEQTFLSALDSADLVPQADPNTASHTQRIMKVTALKQLQASNPALYDPIAIDLAALKALGWSNPEQFMAPPEAAGKPPPEMMERQAKVQNDAKRAEASMLNAQANVQKSQAQTALATQKLQIDANKAESELGLARENLTHKNLDREAKERMQLIDVAERLAVHPYSAGLVQPLIKPTIENIAAQQQMGPLPEGEQP